jgi:2-oxoisovalerate dehydrogenase E1 component
MAHGLAYMESQGLLTDKRNPISLCSLGDGSVTEGEVAEAWQMAVLKELPVLYLIQDNNWGISANSAEMRAMDAYEYAAGFKGMKRMRVDGADFVESWKAMEEAIAYVREKRKPLLLHAKVPLLGHHTSGVRKEWYRTDADLALSALEDPRPRLRKELKNIGVPENELADIENNARDKIAQHFKMACEGRESCS